MVKESPIFSCTYNLLRWLIPTVIKFPRQHRFVLAQALQEDAMRFHSYLVEAVHDPRPLGKLNLADAELDKLRMHIRLSRDLALLTPGQYAHVAEMITEIGKLLGGWKQKYSQKP